MPCVGTCRGREEVSNPQEQELETGGCETRRVGASKESRVVWKDKGAPNHSLTSRPCFCFKHVSYLLALVLFCYCLVRVRFDFSVNVSRM